MHAINLVIHRHVTHIARLVHMIVVIHLTALVVILLHTIVFAAKLVPLHIRVVQVVIMVAIVLAEVASTVPAVIA